MLILWGPASEFSSGHQKCATTPQFALFAGQSMFDNRGFDQVIIHVSQPGDALISEGEIGVYTSSGHAIAPKACI